MGKTASTRPGLQPLHRQTRIGGPIPRFRSLVAGLNDEVWVQEWPRINGTHRRWLVYKPSGVLLASALLPADFEVTQVGEDFILGIAKDEFDRDLIQIYRLDRQP